MFNVEEADTASLIDEYERNNFSEGLTQYYSHIVGLFEKAKQYSYVAEFAHLGLRSLNDGLDVDVKADLLQRLFVASIQTCRFQDAHSAIIRQKDAEL